MARNGSGVYNLPLAAVIGGTVISTTWANTTLNDIATALTGSVAADGQTPMTAQLRGVSGTVSVPGFSVRETTTGLYSPATNEVALSRGGNEAFYAAANVVRLNGAGYQANPTLKNKVINGEFSISQRGTSFAAIGTGTYFVDRFLWLNTSAGVVTASQGSTSLAALAAGFYSSGQVQVTTADGTIAAGDVAAIEHRIEGFFARDLFIGTPGYATLSFWVRSAKTGTHCVALRNSGADRSYVATYTVNVADTWEFKTVNISPTIASGGTWDFTNGVGIRLDFVLACGSTYQTTAGSWQNGDFYGTSGQVNCLDTIGNVFAVTGIQLERGAQATAYEFRTYPTELYLCQRYYESGIYNAGGYHALAGVADWLSTAAFNTIKRATPTITKSGSTFTNCTDQATTANASGFVQNNRCSAANAWFAGFNWAANAEL